LIPALAGTAEHQMLDKATKHYLWLLKKQTILVTWLSTALLLCQFAFCLVVLNRSGSVLGDSSTS